MGKDQELLDAARNGSLAVVEKILSQRAKRSGPLASLRRGPGVNVSDNSGYTPLHHSALNGHKDIVILLLGHDASPNTTDHKGSSPLHLAAWTGNTEIVKLLLVQSNVQPNVNLTNRDGETPLHCAAQYGHADVVSLLLQHNCDPSIRNLKEETALDLAAQYGRLETVEILVKTHPELLASGQQTRRHSALHLASRNGHGQVVQILLSSGFPINALTDGGSALHEAATFGKLDVVRLLLDSGIDLEAEDQRRRTALDILEDLRSHKSQEIASVIQSHGTLITTVDYDVRNANPTKRPLINRSYENVVLPKWASMDGRRLPTPTGSISSSHSPSPTPVYQVPPKTPRSVSVDLERRTSGSEMYQVPPTPELLESSFEGSDLSGTSVYQTPPPPRELDAMSIGSSYYETPPTPRDGGGGGVRVQSQRTSLPESDSSLIYQVPPPPREVLKRMSDPSNTVSGSGSLVLRTFGNADSSRDIMHRQNASGYISMFPQTSKCLRPPQKPPRKTLSPHSPTKFEVQSGPPGVAYEYLCLATTGSPCDNSDPSGPSPPSSSSSPSVAAMQASTSVADYVDMKVRHSFVLSADNEFFKEWKKRSRGFANLEDDERSSSASSSGHHHRTSRQQQQQQRHQPAYENVSIRTSTSSNLHHRRRNQSRAANVYSNVRSSSELGGHESDGGERLQKPSSLDFHNKRRSWDGERSSGGAGTVAVVILDDHQPLSPTGYKQPPTPDFPPPSPGTAELGIHEKMRPLSQEYKRKSRDNETLTEDEVFQLIQDQDGITLQIVTKENKSVSTENIEEVRGDAPFAGLQRGSKPLSTCSSDDSSCPADRVHVARSKVVVSSEARDPHHHHHQHLQQQQYQHHQRSNSEPRWEALAPKPERRAPRRQTNVYENVKPADMEKQSLRSASSSSSTNGQRCFTIKTPSTTPSAYENVAVVESSPASALISPFDENAEWAKINDIMATFGGSVLRPPINSPLYREMEDELINRFHLEVEGVRWQLSPVGQWLSKLDCSDYENHFLANGFDDLQFMGGSMLEDQDLVEMGIANADHRKLILEEAKSLPAVPPVNGPLPVPDTVDAWLKRLHLDIYAETFRKHKYCDMERIMKMWEVELTTVLEITLPGHKKRILASLGVRPVAPFINGSVNDLNSDLSNLKHEINQLDQMARKGETNGNGTLRRRNGHKQPAPLPPARSTCAKSPDHTNGNKDGVSTESFNGGGGDNNVFVVGNYQNGMEGITIREPCQLFSGIPTSLTTQWKHKPEAFIVGACDYTAKYLGSTLVKELKGVESSKKSIQRLKKSTSEIAKVPNVILSISYKGVKFIDANTKYEVCEHEIRNINCACQDADDLNHFAYITKDHQTGNHYCHVFSVVTMDMATEIILTLGQAFEVAYQVAMREKSLQQSSNNKSLRKQNSAPPPLVSPKAPPQPQDQQQGPTSTTITTTTNKVLV